MKLRLMSRLNVCGNLTNRFILSSVVRSRLTMRRSYGTRPFKSTSSCLCLYLEDRKNDLGKIAHGQPSEENRPEISAQLTHARYQAPFRTHAHARDMSVMQETLCEECTSQ